MSHRVRVVGTGEELRPAGGSRKETGTDDLRALGAAMMADAYPGQPRIALGVSRDPRRLPDGEWQELLGRCVHQIRKLAGQDVRLCSSSGTSSALIACGPLADGVHDGPTPRLTLVPMSPTLLTRDGSVLRSDVLERGDPRSAQRRLAEVCPPFGYILRDDASDSVRVGTDALGLRHMYVARFGPVALACSSSTVLAAVGRADLDRDACGVYALLGCFLGNQTMFAGVRKLAPGEHVRMAGGGLSSTTVQDVVPQAVRRGDHFTSVDEATVEGVGTLQRILDGYVAAHGVPVLELSGGLDSRLLLGLALQAGWHDVATLTLGDPGSANRRIASELVRDRSLSGTFVPLSPIDAWDEGTAEELVAAAARHRDFASNPLSGAIYDFVSGSTPSRAQLTGQGGELGRGSYYAGQTTRSRYGARRAEALVRWRLAVNQACHRDLFTADFLAESASNLRELVWDYFEAVAGEWPAVTDQVYLFGRMQRWAGPTYSQLYQDREMLTPFFHPDYVEWASRVPVRLKRNSRTFVRMLEHLDADLAQRPLDSGLTPTQLFDRSIAGRARRLRRDVKRATRKVGQRMSGQRHSPAGADRLAQVIGRRWRLTPPRQLERIGWLDRDALERIHAGSMSLDAVSTAFLVNLEGAVTALAPDEERTPVTA